ncbi:hypothetical protein SAMN05421788_107223 [Filimonas lacunae]|uniref:DUF6377 domain-containing protein n=1 Tax=Filimonas lacunae TaxID=477680 RepID=A0A173MGE4_9BACT|nr:DUF6377 domain-containing protein [Filimonas lacunae]BAV06559.1 regulatory protein SusR [Filimonas lacunae]SIT27391.1 hypothetical protein SAMN05421788_107223 [Filimonas lacunae]
MLKKWWLHVFLLLLLILWGKAYASDSLTTLLDNAVHNKQQYAALKEQRIAMLHHNIGIFPPNQYNKALYQEYRKYRLDSAIYYVQQNLNLVNSPHNVTEKAEAVLQLAGLYSSLGKFRESEQMIASVNRQQLPAPLLPLYYETYLRFFEHYTTNNYNGSYVTHIRHYRDSLLQVLDATLPDYIIYQAQQAMDSGLISQAQQRLEGALITINPQNEVYAMVTYLLAIIHRKQHHPQQEKYYFTLSALADTRNAVKDQASIMDLALIDYAAGDIDRAYLYTQSAVEDALFSKVQFRTVQMAQFFTVINGAYHQREAQRKAQLQRFLFAISLLSVFLVIAVIYVYKQMKKVSAMKEELSVSSRQLAALNSQITRQNTELQETNASLQDANRIKEEYIAHFFDLCSAYINKLENYRHTLYQKATGKKTEELIQLLRSTTVVDTEVEELYRHFDNIFINLYPGFIKDFNALLLPDEQVVLKPGELLNTELRIFALIRLGITDSVKIAAFLRYSLSTIYNYRTRARNKAAVSREEFEIMVMRAGSLQSK